MAWLQEQFGERAVGQNAVGRISTSDNPDIPTWALVASNEEEKALLQAVWRVKFDQRVPQMEGAAVTEAMLCAVLGTSNFKVRAFCDLLHFNYDEPWPRHFIQEGRGDTEEAKAGWRRAWLRRAWARRARVRREGVRRLGPALSMGALLAPSPPHGLATLRSSPASVWLRVAF